MKMYYSKSTHGFYTPSIHGDHIPSDAVEISADVYAALLEAQSTGNEIVADDDGYPMVSDAQRSVRTIISLLAEVAAIRWRVETGGLVIAGNHIATDRESQAQLTSVYTMLKDGLITDTSWKSVNGIFTTGTLAELEPIAQAVAEHVRNCFTVERAHIDAIAQLQTQAELDVYDINTSWPSNSQ